MESRKKDSGLEYAPVHSKTTTGSAPSDAHDNEDAFGFGGPGPIAPLFLDPRTKASLELLGCGPGNCSAA